MTAATEFSEVSKVPEVQESPVIELPKGERVETTAVVQGAMAETWEYAEENYVFAFGDEVNADVQRHICVDSDASRSACHFGHAPEVTARRTAPTLFSIDGSSIEQRVYKKVHWKNCDSIGEVKRIGSTMVESSVLFPVASVLSLEVNGTSVTFSCSGDYFLIRQPMLLPPSSGVPRLTDQKRNGTCWLQADRRVTVEDKSSVNMLAGFSPSQIAPMQEGVATSSTDVAEQFSDPTEVSKTPKESVSVEQGQPLRAAEPDPCVSKVKAKPIPETPTQHTLTAGFWCPVCVYGKDADDPHRRRQDSELEDASFVSRR